MDEIGRKYVKESKDGKAVYRLSSTIGRPGPGREVETMEWGIESYINYCLFPISNCIKQMGALADDQSEVNEYVNIIDRLYDAASVQLGKMNDAVVKVMGTIVIRTTNEDCFGGFMHQDFLDAFVEKKRDDAPEKVL